jgi:outer membrane receptor for ferrienterochelin and colicin
LELEGSEDLGTLLGAAYSLRLYGNLTHLYRARAAQSPAGDDRSINMKNIDAHKAVVGLDFDDRRRFSLGVNGRFRGAILDDDFNAPSYPYPEISTPAVWVYDLHGAIALDEARALRMGVSNLEDVFYAEKKGYPQPGRSYHLAFDQRF